jgi:glycosyltransferase involved in cell wall biosynthesis
MLAEIRTLLPDREHFAVTTKHQTIPGVTSLTPANLDALKHKRIGIAPTLIRTGPEYDALRSKAWRTAPTKILAYNERLERHHLQLTTWIASLLFYRGVPLDRIYLRPRFWPGRRERSIVPDTFQSFDGLPLDPAKPHVAIVSPYFPYPLSHGGAVRIFHLMREAARDFNLTLFAFSPPVERTDLQPVQEICSRIVLLPIPRYREPRWASLDPPEVAEYRVPLLTSLIRQSKHDLLQSEYTQMAQYDPDVLVEHDVTFDLYRQVYEEAPSLSNRWNLWRWQRYERRALRNTSQIVVMSDKDKNVAHALAGPRTSVRAGDMTVIPNGVDLSRFQPEPEKPGHRILFVGSFRHFPNVVAYRFFTEEVWPLVLKQIPDAELTVVAGPDPELYFDAPLPPRTERHSFVRDVKPLYVDTNLVIVPTRVSAGTNLKVLEAMAMNRAVVSTTSGCAGLGLTHQESVWIADSPEAYADAVVHLLNSPQERARLAANARDHAIRNFDWQQIGRLQKELWNGLLHSRRNAR